MEINQSLFPEPKLAPAGAGLPLFQRLLLKTLVGPILSKRSDLLESRKNFEAITEKIIQKISKISPEMRTIQVLVDPIVGLEDSSRYWSLNGTLEHVLTVCRKIEFLILSLSAGVVPEGEADIAKLKPQNQTTDSLAEFRDYAPELMRRIDEKLAQPGMNIHSRHQFLHPWFGGFRARQWYWLLATHEGIHYQQIKMIIRALEKKLAQSEAES